MTESPTHDDHAPVPGRGCNGCTLCCLVLAVQELAKPALQACRHCDFGAGCTIYADRPRQCQTYFCGYLEVPEVPEYWHPLVSHMVLQTVEEPRKLLVHVDPNAPNSWLVEPYYSDLKRWGGLALERDGRVYVLVRSTTVIMFADRHADLGVLKGGELIDVVSVPGPDGMKRYAYAKMPNEAHKGPAFWK
ncbi:MAG TPA: hypothetical protein VGB82_06015 [Alphaproteobacteria bacterium]